MAFVKLNITGMSCEDCANSAQQALNTLPGVSACVSFSSKAALIETTGETDTGQLLNAVESKGYGASIQTGNGDTEKATGDSKLKIAIIGTGSGAFAAAIKAAEEGAHCAVAGTPCVRGNRIKPPGH